ncbi:D-alanyl-D-alanine carboxypeptidase family protein [Cellulomonas sp. Y8]|uniref:M15 family metallopeptidase n=1 Tax=Cellulomonas sp. Y8 TaxID=2591145 RepID=UPI0011C98F8A|nr:M15 family metallopeptidase [Cellulomonas sp. Y8]
MDGITATSARILEIRQLIGATTPRLVKPAGGSGDAFAAALSAAVDDTTPSPSTARNAQGVPADLAAHGNGKIPSDALSEVGSTGHRLWAPASQALDQLMTAAERDGIDVGITDSYRSYDAQVDVARRKGLYSQGGLAAQPGTSPHGWGVAVDLDLDDAAQRWMRANAGRFGFVEDTPREPWHWVYKT